MNTPGNGSSSGNSSTNGGGNSNGSMGTVTMADGITHTVRGAGDLQGMLADREL